MFETRMEVAEAILSARYTSTESMPDEELKLAFQKAEAALEEFQSLLPGVY